MKSRLIKTFLLATAVSSFACSNYGADNITEGEKPKVPDQESFGVTVTEFKGDTKKWIFYADYVATYNDSRLSKAKKIKIDFFDETGNRFSTLTADSGLIMEKSKDLIAQGNVVMVSNDGTRLETEELKWDNRKGKVVSDLFVRITQGDNVITGIGLESDPRLEHFEIKNRIRGRVYEKLDELDKKSQK